MPSVASPIVNMLYQFGTFATVNDQYRYRLPSSLPPVLFLFQHPTQDTTSHVVIMPPQVPYGTGQASVTCPLFGICRMFSLMVRRGDGFWKEDGKGGAFSSHRIEKRQYQHDLSLEMLPLTIWLRSHLSGSPLYSYSPHPSLTVLFGRKRLCSDHITLNGGGSI